MSDTKLLIKLIKEVMYHLWILLAIEHAIRTMAIRTIVD